MELRCQFTRIHAPCLSVSAHACAVRARGRFRPQGPSARLRFRVAGPMSPGAQRTPGFNIIRGRAETGGEVAVALQRGSDLDQLVVRSGRVRPHARPSTGLRPIDQPRANRVERDVAHPRPRCVSSITTAPNRPCQRLSGPAVLGVDVAGIAAMRIGEGAPQPFHVRRNDDDVTLVRCKAVASDLRSVPCRGLGQDAAVQRVVAIFKEGLRAGYRA